MRLQTSSFTALELLTIWRNKLFSCLFVCHELEHRLAVFLVTERSCSGPRTKGERKSRLFSNFQRVQTRTVNAFDGDPTLSGFLVNKLCCQTWFGEISDQFIILEPFVCQSYIHLKCFFLKFYVFLGLSWSFFVRLMVLYLQSMNFTCISLGRDPDMIMGTFLWKTCPETCVAATPQPHMHPLAATPLPHWNPLAATLTATYKPSCCHTTATFKPSCCRTTATFKPSCCHTSCHIQTFLLPHHCHIQTLLLPHLLPHIHTNKQAGKQANKQTNKQTIKTKHNTTKQNK